jgi:hypothetical protein
VLNVERVTVDPTAEDSSRAPLDLVGLDPSWGIYLLDHDYPTPELETQRAGSVDTEGDRVVGSRYLNRVLSVKVRVFEPADPAATNLVTNPIAAVGVTGWAGVSLESGPTRVLAANTPQGRGIDTAVEARTNAAGDYLYTDVAVTNGKTYRFSVYVQKRTGVFGELRAVVYNAAGAVKKATGATIVKGAANLTAEGWVRLDVSFTADATATWRVGVEETVFASTFYATGAMVEESPILTPFFCGETPGCDWTGARHASTSTRPAPDGTRFRRIYRDLTRKLDRITRSKSGTLRRSSALGNTMTWDLRSARITDAPQDLGIARRRAEVTIAFEALPFGRSSELQIGGNFDELALPALTFLAENVPGDVPALGRLVIEDRQAQAQRAVWWALQQETYSASPDAALFYQAESRTLLGSSAKSAGWGGAASGGETVLNGGLVNAYQAILSTQASGGGNHLAHVGSYRVFARIYRPSLNLGEVSVKLAWRQGDFVNVTENDEDEVRFGANENEDTWTIEDLGIVTLSEVPAGTTQRWEGRILAKSTASGDDINIDWLMLVPTDEGSGEAIAEQSLDRPAVLAAFDDYSTQAAGALAGKAAGIGGNYSGAGDPDDFTVVAGTTDQLQRTAVSDVAGTPRYALLGATKYSDIVFKLRLGTNNTAYDEKLAIGQFVRYVDVNNWLALVVQREMAEVWPGVNANWYYTLLYKKVAGVKSIVPGAQLALSSGATPTGTPVSWETTLVALSTGEWRVGVDFAVAKGVSGPVTVSGVDSVLATAGTLKEGQIGLLDEKTGAGAETRNYDNVEAWVPTFDQSIYASRRFELLHDQVRRQDSAGLTWGEPPYEGDYLLVPPAGAEKRPTRFLVKGSRNPVADAGIDDIRANLFVTPRYLMADPT